MKKVFLFLLSCVALTLTAQVTTTPAVIQPGYTGQIVITFDPAGGNGGMRTATKCYAHTGYCTATQKWLGVIGTPDATGSNWRAADQPQLTATTDGKWQLVINNMYDFYHIPAGTEVTALAFVFHDGPGGSKEGKTAAGGDIFIILGEDSSSSDIWAGFTPAACQQQTRPTGIDQGIYYDANDPTAVTLCTYAASKTAPAQHVFLLGDMTDWKLNNQYQLKRDGNYFWIRLTGLTPGKEYRFQYAVVRADGVKKQISDLFSEKVIHPDDAWEPKSVDPTLIDYPIKGADGGYVTVIQPGKPAYPWSQATLNFKRPDKNNLVIYEVWVYDYTALRSIPALMNKLNYIQNLGVNAIELMPVCEFDGNYNWGYSPNHYFALDRAYGSPEMFKAFIDECHRRGIAVIMDMVFNHATGLNPMNKLYPYGTDLASNPWFNVTAPHPDNVYEDWNHGFEPAHKMFIRALKYWLTEYKVDGFRMDLSHGFCSNVANTSVQNIKDYYTNGVQAASPGAYFILEHWGSNMDTERPQLINGGMLCWNNTSEAYQETAMGWIQSNKDAFNSANQDGYVSYCESHDEERMQYKAKKYGNGDLPTNTAARIARVPANIAFNVLLNGSHMIWQFEEIGYDFSINSDVDHPNAENSDYRCNKKTHPDSKGYFNDPDRLNAFRRSAQAVALRTKLMPNVFAGNPTAASLNGGQPLRTIQWGTNVFAAANFAVSGNQTVNLPAGTWYDYYNNAAKMTSSSVSLAPGELRIFTGSAVQAPVISDINYTPVEEVQSEEAKADKVLLDGVVYVVRNGRYYDLMGRLVR
ncbi:MAG: hypothetical protein IJ581_07970 [Paludibacteraceae bacterium]|nr:hypothetical protein [Paludibacteraceae bacterium]